MARVNGGRKVSKALAIVLAMVTVSQMEAANPRVDLEIAAEPAFSMVQAAAWSELLSKAGFSSVRIRGGNDGEQAAIMTRGSAAAPAYQVLGILTGNNQLLLPEGRFGLMDRGAIEKWLEKLRSGGEEEILIKPVAFGLLPRQLVAVHEALAVSVKTSTAGKYPREVAKAIADGLTLKFVTDGAGQQALAAGEPVVDELQGVSSGTALAAVLRPAGLALVPVRSGSEVQLRIAAAKSVKEFWPIGWPPKGNPRETLPALFEFLNVEITQVPISEAINAIGGRLKAPVLLDHNSIALYRVNLKTPVDLPKANTFYGAALDRLLAQAKLKYELKVDEAGKPVVWITTLRQ
jgi:hypothetical protein